VGKITQTELWGDLRPNLKGKNQMNEKSRRGGGNKNSDVTPRRSAGGKSDKRFGKRVTSTKVENIEKENVSTRALARKKRRG